jgi:NADPH:quinone reductase
VLVTGGAGAVGFYAVQFARLAGARALVATVSTDEKARMAAEAGAPVIVNYRTEDVARCIMEATERRGVDHISEVDFGGNLSATLAVMKTGCAIGAYASKGAPEPVLPFYPLLFANVVVRFIQCYAMPDDIRERAHADLARWCGEGQLKHLPTKIMPLEEAAAAHELVERGGFIGKVMLGLYTNGPHS